MRFKYYHCLLANPHYYAWLMRIGSSGPSDSLGLEPQGGGGVLGLTFTGYVPLASQSPYPIIVYSVANYRPHLIDFRANM